MKKSLTFAAVAMLICVLFFASCELTKKSNTVSGLADSRQSAQGEGNLLKKYDISMSVDIWNDYMPVVVPDGGTYPEHYSRCFIHFDSPVKLPPMEVSAVIITGRIKMQVPLYEFGDRTNDRLFRKDFCPVNNILLNDEEEYTIEVTVKIRGEQQTITTAKQKVFVTW
jgi:hypothetical protein